MIKTTTLIMCCMLFQQSISQTIRGLRDVAVSSEPSTNATTINLPSQLLISNPRPQVLSDQCTLEISSPELQTLILQLFEYLEDSVIWEKTILVFPGNQNIPLYLYDLVEGEYSLAIWQDEEVVYRYLKIEE